MSLSDNWEDFVATVRSGVTELAKNTLGGALDQAKADAESFLETAKPKLRRWADALANGQITREEFEFLVGTQRDLASLHAITALGMIKTRVERFRTGLISLVVNSAFGAIGL